MANNKVVLGDGTVLVDLTGDTVTASTLGQGVTAHNAAGEQITGTGAIGGGAFDLGEYNNAGSHNAIYRGKNLGSSVTAEQWAAIYAGTFDDMFIGDYWEINSRIWYIAAFNYWVNMGDTACSTNHVLIVPATNLVSGVPMNKTDTTAGAYAGSNFYTGANNNSGKSQCVTIIDAAFGSSHILSHREYLKNAVTNGYESAGTWYDSTMELLTEQMVYGCRVFGNVANGTAVPASYTIDNAQLPLFSLNQSFICNNTHWWLRDVASSTHFAYVNNGGLCSCTSAAQPSINIRPVFAICA